MKKRKWLLIIVLILAVAAYIKLFYKTYSNTFVPKKANCIAVFDVKRITNTLIWNFITTPSQWKWSSIFPGKDTIVDIDDMIEIPDYVFVFHAANQPLNIWYSVFAIKDEDDFQKGLKQYQFLKNDSSNSYFSDKLKICFIRNGNNILVSNNTIANQPLQLVADTLFNKKEFVSKEILKRNIDAASHLAIQIMPNDFLQHPSIATLNFDNNKIEIIATLTPFEKYAFAENNFSCCNTSLYDIGFTQPSAIVYGLLNDSTKATTSKMLNFNIDSFLLPSNQYYSIDVSTIKERIDSAITYNYDDNFNEIKTVVADTLHEPAFEFVMKGNECNKVQSYLRNNGKLENTKEGELFTCMPFVKSYCNKINDSCLSIKSNNYTAITKNNAVTCILYCNAEFDKIPVFMLKYLPDATKKIISNIESVKIIATKKERQIIIKGIIQKKKNDLPVIPFN